MERGSGTRSDLTLAIFAVIVFSFSYTFIKIAMLQLPPTTVAALRFLLAFCFVLPFTLAKYRAGLFGGHTKKDWLYFVGIGISVVFIPQFLQNIGLVYTTAAMAGVIQSTIPVFAGILAFLLLKEKVSPRRWMGAGIALLGVILLSTGGNLISGFSGSTSYGNLLEVGATISSGAGSILVKKVLETKKPGVVVAMSFLIGGIMLTAAAVPLDRSSWPSSVDTLTIFALLAISGLYGAAIFGWYSVLEHVSVARLYFALFLLPLLGIVAPVLLLGESFSILDIGFAALIILGLVLAEVHTNEKSDGKTQEAEVRASQAWDYDRRLIEGYKKRLARAVSQSESID